jgi:diguanylate cyclase (GGDEF)-like protein
MTGSGPVKRRRRPRKSDRKDNLETGPAASPAGKLPRAYLERAFAKLAEENARLRREVLASSSLWQVAHQDALTGLWNRRYMDERLAEEVSRSKREAKYRFSVVVVDVDNLKRINDHIGHAAGDEALRWVAQFLREGLRLHDICARLGGDEFLLLLPACGEKDARDFIERLNRRWHAAAERDASIAAISIGSASYPTHGSTLPELLAVADDAMYTEKRRRNPPRPAPSAPSVRDGGRAPANAKGTPANDGEREETAPPILPGRRVVLG